MPIVDNEYLLLSRAGRASPGLEARRGAEVIKLADRAHAVKAAREARQREASLPVVIRLPVRRPIHLVPRGRQGAR